MKGLLKKDLLLLKSQIKYIVTIVVLCLIMAYANSGFAYISSYLTFLISSATHINLETVIVQLAMLFSAFIYISITIPVMMKYGREKATIIVLMLMLVLFLAVASGATSVGMLMSQIFLTIKNYKKEPLQVVAVLFVYILSNHYSK